jgi:hypothetical protein
MNADAFDKLALPPAVPQPCTECPWRKNAVALKGGLARTIQCAFLVAAIQLMSLAAASPAGAAGGCGGN